MGIQVNLEIQSYRGISIGASHYYGFLKWTDNGKYHKIELESELSAAEAKELIKIDRGDFNWKAGMKSGRFERESDIIEIAIRDYKAICPGAVVLVKGSNAYVEPQLVLDGPAEYKERVNLLYRKAEKIGFWDKKPTEMAKLCYRWEALKKKFGIGTPS